MKLSLKFFCIAYIIVLLSTGIGGIFLINNATDVLWNSQAERVVSSAKYACDSFVSFAEVSTEEITDSQMANIKKQIGNIMDSSVTKLDIIPLSQAGEELADLEDNKGFTRFISDNREYIMESVCRLNTGSGIYFIIVSSDFTDIKDRCNMLWQGYGIVVLALSVISGLLLFILARQITKPINRLTKAADKIASGSYGETVGLNKGDWEIMRLADSFNTMSVMVKKTIEDIKKESEKRNMFVADFTHEIKTPMTAIIGYAQMLNSYDLSAQEIKQASKAIFKEGKRLERLSLQLLDLYVYQNDEIQLEQISLQAITKQLETTLIFLSRKYNVSFSVEFRDERVMANSVLLFSLIYNLADNAFKASAPNTAIRIFSRTKDNKIQISVKDQGRGIAPENIRLLTEPFFREDKARSRNLGGAGLGLALCKEIAELHGTKLCFKSELEKGTTVSFELERGADNE